MIIKKQKIIEIVIRLRCDKDYVYCSNLESFRVVWGTSTTVGDLNGKGIKKDPNTEEYLIPMNILRNRLDFFNHRINQYSNARDVINQLLKEQK